MRSVGTFFRQLPDIEAKYPKSRWLFLTLTVKNVPLEHLRAEIVKMNRGWQRLIQRKDWPSDGWIRTVEVTRDKDGLAHPHFHAMLMVRPGYFSQGYVSQAEWTKRWRQVMRLDYDPIIDVRAIKPKVQGQTLQAAVVETLKYGTKVEDGMEHADWLYGITEQLHKMRFLASGGVLKGVMVEAKTDEELVGGDEPADEPGTGSKILFKWQRQELLYRKHGA